MFTPLDAQLAQQRRRELEHEAEHYRCTHPTEVETSQISERPKKDGLMLQKVVALVSGILNQRIQNASLNVRVEN